MDEVRAKREAVVITKRGKPVVKLVPMEQQSGPDPIFGFLEGKAWLLCDPIDLVAPIVLEEDWSNTWELAE
jgi:antitoxin (DNA-binding transcriptional repressor) of toxin-antitoxin stability system